ncbi:MAG: cyanobactin biosynthesis PatC/TenC/TruC family protein [Cyanobacteriota bacterium]
MSPEDKPRATPAAPPVATAPKERKSYLPTSQTGLQDYSFWWEYARKHAKEAKATSAFLRGRIWT